MAKSYYPINLDIEGKKVLVAGGGVAAERKIKTLLSFSARVVAVSPRFTAGIYRLSRKVELIQRNYNRGDLNRVVLAIAATDDPVVNHAIYLDAKQKKIMVNVVDCLKLCSFVAPSVIKRGPLVVSISTSGKAPGFSKELRLRLEKVITPQLGRIVTALGKRRTKAILSQRIKRLGITSARA